MNQSKPLITEVNKDTFWSLIDQAKEHQGGPNEWLMEQLVGMGTEQAKTFDTIARVYMDLAYQYGLWTAASVIERGGCTDDGFMDFRQWLVGQGRGVYMAALKDPDSLADAPDYREFQYDSLPVMGDYAYEELTGRNAFEDFDPGQYDTLKTELEKGIVYGEGIGYPYDADDVPDYLPRLCQKYGVLDADQSSYTVLVGTWNPISPEIQAARKSAQKSKKVQNRGDSR